MDAISRNTAAVAQDFHKAGGVQELKIPANHQLLFNNRLLTQWKENEAAALLASLSNNYKNHNNNHNNNNNNNEQQKPKRQRQHSTGDDDENTPSSASSTTSNEGEIITPIKLNDKRKSTTTIDNIKTIDERKAMSTFLSKNFNLKESLLIPTKTKTTKTATVIQKNNNNLEQQKQQQQQKNYNENQENQEQLIQSPPAFNLKYNNNNNNNKQNTKNQNNRQQQKYRLDLYKDNKENTVISTTIDSNIASAAAAQVAANFLTTLEYQNMNNKIGTHLENYVKELMNKYYAVDLLTKQQHQQQQQQQKNNDIEIIANNKRKRVLSETEEYIEYLKNKSDITLTITPKINTTTTANNNKNVINKNHEIDLIPNYNKNKQNDNYSKQIIKNNNQHKTSRKNITQLATLLPLLADAASKQQYLATPLDFSKKSTTINENSIELTANDKRNSRKQSQPKKKVRPSPEVVVAMLRDKYLNRMVDRKLSCRKCSKTRQNSMLVFNYHTKGSLALHRLWKHSKIVTTKLTTTHQK